ncbi:MULTISPECIES: NUDIX hydrolase [Pontibacillus]|uniref:NUDIX domain-containing protein n=1 Tax=Pontibacillus chungwhensis TaxID=265426 RepID=A0ABY8V003_9BACI|nr:MULTISPECIES: NUDIX domain-containing protein [Pontibacillus]MCD5324641.1 NUDIX domain-containing protein [Pontibacillus sp. HN14]WIF99064.1 NUDIX domain-containing protein [Pontibacillus chungwhensis]
MFYKEYREEEAHEKHYPVRRRKAVRAVILKEDKILLIKTNQDIYAFPGGGVQSGERDDEGVIREVAEETGYTGCAVHEKVGAVVESNVDHKKTDQLFEMVSDYYRCELIHEKKVPQQLEDYEQDEEYDPQWVKIEDALRQNESERGAQEARWLKREIFVLKMLQKQLTEGTR